MRTLEEGRRTGRTTRMLDAAIREAEQGRYVVIVAGSHDQARMLFDELRWKLVHLADEKELRALVTSLKICVGQTGSISVIGPNEQRLDPRSGRLDGAHPNVKVFADHFWVEQEMRWALEQWLTWQE